MTNQELGAIGELVGGVSVIATLIYLAIQTRQAKQHIITQTNYLSATALRDELTVFMEPQILRSAYVKSYESPNELCIDEQMNMDVWLQLSMHMRESEYY
jgi:hypothetical protein